jgi:hypothetical protein
MTNYTVSTSSEEYQAGFASGLKVGTRFSTSRINTTVFFYGFCIGWSVGGAIVFWLLP